MKSIVEIRKNVRTDLPERFSELDFFQKNFSRIVNLFDGNVMPPYEVLIHPCSYCNLSCKWCIGSYVANNKEKLLKTNLNKIENMEKVIEGILSYKKVGKDYINGGNETFKVENVSFSGITGEPMIAKEAVLYAINKLKENNIRVGMFTNGVLLTHDIHDTLLKMDYILISLDAGENSTYVKLKCNGTDNNEFHTIINNIKALNSKKKEINSKTDINIGYMLNQFNYNEIYKIAKEMKKIGVYYFRLKTDISSQILLDEEQHAIVKEQIEKIKSELEDDNFKFVAIHRLGNETEKIRDFKKCFIHYLYGAVSADGNVYPCNYHPKVDGYTYDSAITNKFGDIWENIKNYEIDKNIPKICPNRCDPFKTRANRLLEAAYEIYKEEGIESLKDFIFKE